MAVATALALVGVALTSDSVAKTTPSLRVRLAEESAAREALRVSEQARIRATHAAIVVVIDGARWQDVVGGGRAMPELVKLGKAHGAIVGAPWSGTLVHASGPNFVSMPGYAEILGGAPARDCPGNDECAAATHETLVDAVRAESGSAREVAVFSSWPDLVRVASSGPEAVVVSGGRHLTYGESVLRSDPAMAEALDRGERADSWPGESDYRPDRFTAELAIRYLEAEHPRFLFVSLGDTDEYAHEGNHSGYIEALRAADRVIADLYARTHGANARGRSTTIYVTADHGRSNDFRNHGEKWPESSRSWLVVLGDAPERGTISGDHALADIAPTVRAWLGLPADETLDAGHAIGGLVPSLLE